MSTTFDLEQNLDFRTLRTRVFIPENGQLVRDSYEQFGNPADALAYWWALAKCDRPRLGYIHSLADGFVPNTTIRDKQTPAHMLQTVKTHTNILNRGMDPLTFHRISMRSSHYTGTPVNASSQFSAMQFSVA